MTAGRNREVLRRGFLVNLGTKLYISLAHTDADIDRTLDAFEASLRAIL